MFPLDVEKAYIYHAFFEWLGIAIGAYIYRTRRRYQPQLALQSKKIGTLVAGSLFGAVIGSKVVAKIQYPLDTLELLSSGNFLGLLNGQSIVGGIVGGWLGVELGKRLAGIYVRTGDDFLWPLIIGMSVGRVGCFLSGLHDATYGNSTQLPWAIDFGDGVPRHPTQLYDIGFLIMLGIALNVLKSKFEWHPGLAFRYFVLLYLFWRFCVDALKPIPYSYPFGFSGVQWVCLLSLPLVFRALRNQRTVPNL